MRKFILAWFILTLFASAGCGGGGGSNTVADGPGGSCVEWRRRRLPDQMGVGGLLNDSIQACYTG